MYDHFVANGYQELAANPQAYPVPVVVSELLSHNAVPQQEKTVLDLCCGPGNLKSYTHFALYTGVDVSPDMLRAAAEAGYSQLIEGNALEYARQLPNDSYDSVMCLSATYFMPPDQAKELVEHMQRIAREYWLATFDAIPPVEAEAYIKRRQIAMWNHAGMALQGVVERRTEPGWISGETGKPVPIEYVLGSKTQA